MPPEQVDGLVHLVGSQQVSRCLVVLTILLQLLSVLSANQFPEVM